MKSSTGAHYIALDHVRALAAFMVVAWHFTHGSKGYPVPFDFVPAVFPLAVLDEGHTGVALFMTLSGYLFAKLLDGKAVDHRAFLWNRALRLLPLLALVVAINALTYAWRGSHILLAYLGTVAAGVLAPTLPNGGWSITVEFHYYATLPFFLALMQRSIRLPLALLAGMLGVRAVLWLLLGTVQVFAYMTIVGRIDQFVLGMVVFQARHIMYGRHGRAALVSLAFFVFYWWFDAAGGTYGMPSDPSTHPVWIVMPTIEGLAYALLIAWYDTSFTHKSRGLSGLIGRLGEYSYSIYLLHFFVILEAPGWIDRHVVPLTNFYIACLAALCFYFAMLPVGWLSFRFVESPFLKLRKRYVLAEAGGRAAPAGAVTGIGLG